MSRIEVDYNRDLDALAELLSSVKRPGSFFASGSIETPMPRLEIKGVGTIAFPVLDSQAKEIVTQAERAPYGRGDATLVDTNVRRVWQIAPGRIRLGGKSWKKTFDSILDTVVKQLGCQGAPVSAKLYKLLIYDKGGFFVSHRDTEKAAGMFATLVVVLPSLHEGGTLLVRHDGREVTLDLGVESEDVLCRLSYAAFYADCEHEVRPITKGNRICLVYNLIQGRRGKRPGRELPQAPDYRPETARAAEILGAWAKRPEAPPKIVYLLEHQYSPAGLSFSGLKNGDAAFGSVLADAAARAGHAVHLGIVHIEESGSAEVYYDSYRGSRSRWDRYDDEDDDSDEGEQADDDDFEIIEACESYESIDNWVDTHDRPVDFGRLPLAKGELLPAGSLDGEKPDTQRVSEATGNEGGSYERAYHRAAIVLWHKSRYAEALLQGGGVAAIPYLKKLVEGWSAAGKPSRNSKTWREIVTLTKGVIQKWAVHGDPYWREHEGDCQPRCEMLTVLKATGDAVLLHQFIEKIVVREFDGTEQEQLLASCSVLGAKATGELFARLVTNRMKARAKACAELLRRIARGSARGTKPPSAMTGAYRKIADAAVKALPALRSDPGEDDGGWSGSWRWREDPPLEAATITNLLEALRSLEAAKLMSAAVASIAADPETFAPDAVLVPALQTLHRTHGASVTSDKNLLQLWQHTAGFLLARSPVPPQRPTDWAQRADIGCSCEDCEELKEFATNPLEKTHGLRIRKDRRRHLHRIIERHDLDMSHKTERRGSPHTLVCTKTRRHHQARVKQYKNDVKCLNALVDLLDKRPRKLLDLLTRVHEAIGPSA